MISKEALLLCAIFAPTLGACLLPLLGQASARARNALAFLLVAASLACSLALVPQVLGGATVTAAVDFGASFSFKFQADGLAVFMAIVSSLISAIIVLYSTGYISHYRYQNEYYFMVVLFLGAMMGLVFSAHLIVLYVFWEITAIASWRLIGFFREKDYVLRADKAFLVTAFGALAMLFGFVMIANQAGSFDLTAIAAAARHSHFSDLGVALILLGILSKSATLPLHTWLPDAGVAPSPVTALLHAAVLVKIGVYVYARLFIVAMPLSETWQTIVLVIAAASALVSAGAALLETDLKRIIAFSTVSQIAFIFLGFASGTTVGIAGALLYILMHGLAKGGLFLCAGIVEHGTHTKDVRQMGGLARTMPITAVAFFACALSVMGVPPFGGFFSKFMVILGAVGYAGLPAEALAKAGAGAAFEPAKLWVPVVFAVGAFMTILYLLRVFNLVFLGEAKAPAPEGSRIMIFSVALLAALSLAGGILINIPSDFAQTVVRQMTGGTP